MQVIEKAVSEEIIKNFTDSHKGNTFPSKGNRIAFFDIETTGLSPKTSSLYMIGLLYLSTENTYLIRQWFADTYNSEELILKDFLSFIDNYFLNTNFSETDFLYSFNGKTFDIPYIKDKCKKYDILIPNKINYLFDDKRTDLYLSLKPLKKIIGLTNAKQKTFEEYMGLNRKDLYSGKDLIKKYSEYMTKKRFIASETGDFIDSSDSLIESEVINLKKILLLHNFCDLEGMLVIFPLILYSDVIKCNNYSDFSNKITEEDYKYDDNNSKVKVYASIKNFSKRSTLECEFMVVKAELKYYFKDYKNYYYIPEEDTIIHKSLSAFIDKDKKEKATKDNCFLKKTGSFIALTNYNKLKTDKKELLSQLRIFSGNSSLKDSKDDCDYFLELETLNNPETLRKLLYITLT